MKKVFLLPALCVLLSCSQLWTQTTIQKEQASPFRYRFFVLNDVPPAPLPGHDPSKAEWVNFWMFKDGYFSQADTLTRSFSSHGEYPVELRRRGKYSGTTEPPHARITVDINAGSDGNQAPGVPAVSNLDGTETDRIQPQWSAAQPNDSICLALIVRNPSDENALINGTLKLRFPTDIFSYAGQVFPDQPGFTLRSGAPETDAGDAQFAAGTVYTWDVGALKRGEERVLFVCIKAKSDVRDSTFHDLWLEWSGGVTTTSTTINKVGDEDGVIDAVVVVEAGRTTPSAVTFRGTSRTTISMNLARDPNALYVDPPELTPTRSAPAQQLSFTLHAENLGGAMANNLSVEVFLDPRIDPASLILVGAHFPSAPIMAENFTNINPIQEGTTLRWDFNGINLQATHGDFAAPDSQYTQASFSFLMSTRAGIDLVEGQHIVSRARITMSTISGGAGGREVINDAVLTNPDTVFLHKRCRGRLPFGHVLGIKGHLDLSGSGAAAKSQGLALSWRFPLVRPCGNSLSSPSLRYLPKLFWQIEAGWGNGAFEDPANGQRFDTRHIHFSPAQLRFYQKVAQNQFLAWANLSVGYSVDYTYRMGRPGGGELSLPGAFGRRLEHELFASVGVGNTVGVPGYTVGVGYKHRFNRLLGTSLDYGFPFAYVQIDVIRLRRRFAQIWTNTYHW